MKKTILILTIAILASCTPMTKVGHIKSVWQYNILMYDDYKEANKNYNKVQKYNYVESRQLIRYDSVIIIQLFPNDSLKNSQLDNWFVRDIAKHRFYTRLK